MAIRNKGIGIGSDPPKATCESKRCPWHGSLKVRGKIFKGTVKSARALRTAIIEWDYVHYVPKYERSERKRTRVAAHNPECINAKAGESVIIAECRPLSKMKRFVIVEVLE